EVLDLDSLPVAQLADDRESARRKGLAGHGALLVHAAHRILDGEPPRGPCPAELLYEIGVKRAAPVLAVGDRMEPHGFLKPDDIADAAVLQLVKGRRADPVAYLRAPRLQPARIEACEEIQILPPQCLDDRAVQILLDDEMAEASGGDQADA